MLENPMAAPLTLREETQLWGDERQADAEADAVAGAKKLIRLGDLGSNYGPRESLADILAWFGARAWAEQVGGLLTLKLSSISATIPFALMLLILMVRPSGLMGEKS